MRFLWRMVFGGAILLILVPLFGGAESGNDELEHNRLLLEKWRKDPEHNETLRRNLRAFLALPEERQKRLRQLDHDLHEEESATSVRLQSVLERYAEWLQGLPEADRQRIQREADPQRRLEIVRELREREWVQRLPRAIREDLEKLPADQRRVRITQLRQEEHKRRRQWQVAIRNWAELTQNRPQITRLQDLAPDVKTFVHESLFPMLTPEEKNRLLQAEGKHPLFLRTLVELADKHPIRLPGPTTGPARFEQLPSELQTRLKRVKDWPSPQVKQAEGKWPDYAIQVTQFARASAHKVRLLKQLGPCRPGEFSPPVREFIEKKLVPALGADDAAMLHRAEGNWPRYPNLLLRFAWKHGLQVPGMRLPGPPQMWNPYRVAPTAKAEPLPEVPINTLREFARAQLDAEEQASLPMLWFNDPASRAKVNQMYLERNPKVLQQLRRADQKAQQRKQRATKN
jgi:hypothetical protein